MSDNPRVFPLFAQLIDTMKYKPENVEQAATRTASSSEQYRKNAESAVDITVNQAGKPEILVAFPRSEERKSINEVFEKIVAELKQMQIFTHEEKPVLSDAFEPSGISRMTTWRMRSFTTFSLQHLSIWSRAWSRMLPSMCSMQIRKG